MQCNVMQWKPATWCMSQQDVNPENAPSSIANSTTSRAGAAAAGVGQEPPLQQPKQPNKPDVTIDVSSNAVPARRSSPGTCTRLHVHACMGGDRPAVLTVLCASLPTVHIWMTVWNKGMWSVLSLVWQCIAIFGSYPYNFEAVRSRVQALVVLEEDDTTVTRWQQYVQLACFLATCTWLPVASAGKSVSKTDQSPHEESSSDLQPFYMFSMLAFAAAIVSATTYQYQLVHYCLLQTRRIRKQLLRKEPLQPRRDVRDANELPKDLEAYSTTAIDLISDCLYIVDIVSFHSFHISLSCLWAAAFYAPLTYMHGAWQWITVGIIVTFIIIAQVTRGLFLFMFGQYDGREHAVPLMKREKEE